MADTSRCSVCGRPVTERFRPFCSARCADVDLGRWLTGQYRVPAERETETDGIPADEQSE